MYNLFHVCINYFFRWNNHVICFKNTFLWCNELFVCMPNGIAQIHLKQMCRFYFLINTIFSNHFNLLQLVVFCFGNFFYSFCFALQSSWRLTNKEIYLQNTYFISKCDSEPSQYSQSHSSSIHSPHCSAYSSSLSCQ